MREIGRVSLLPYRVPLTRSPTQKVGPVGACIYCGATGDDVELTDEHIIPDGLGGDLVLAKASCKDCAKATSRAELHLLREVMQFPRGVTGVRSRKRKSAPPTIDVELDDASPGEAIPKMLGTDAPFIFPFIITDELPGELRGAQPDEMPKKLRMAIFGAPSWNDQSKKWLGGTGSFGWKNRLHAGIVGQALAKIAHAYACAAIGMDAFHPCLTDYIRAFEPPFDAHHIGIHDSGSFDESLHYIDLQVAYLPQQTVLGLMHAPVYVVFLRVFSNQPAPSVLVVVGRPRGGVLPNLKVMDLSGGL